MIQTDEANVVFYADNPDDMDSIINNDLPSTGGVVRAKSRKTITDSDWSTRIDIPNNDPSRYVIDMRGWEIDIDSFSPTDAYIKKPLASSLGKRVVEFYGPDYANFADVTSPPAFLELNDLDHSRVYIPAGDGNVAAVYRNKEKHGSGHMNKVSMFWRSPKTGIELVGNADGGSNASNDRSFYWGQIANIENVGVDCEFASNNNFFVQPENGQGSATGYRLDSDCERNQVWITHANTSEPLDIQGRRNKIRHPISQSILKSKIGCRPEDVARGREGFYYKNYTAHDQWYDHWDKLGSGFVLITDFGLTQINAGGSNGDETGFRTQTRLGRLGQGFLLYGYVRTDTISNAILRWGVGEDGDNFIGLLADGSNTNWHFNHTDGGTLQTDTATDSSTSISGGEGYQLLAMITDGQQEFWIDQSHEHSATETINLGDSSLKHFIGAENSGGTNARIDMIELQHIGTETY